MVESLAPNTAATLRTEQHIYCAGTLAQCLRRRETDKHRSVTLNILVNFRILVQTQIGVPQSQLGLGRNRLIQFPSRKIHDNPEYQMGCQRQAMVYRSYLCRCGPQTQHRHCDLISK